VSIDRALSERPAAFWDANVSLRVQLRWILPRLRSTEFLIGRYLAGSRPIGGSAALFAIIGSVLIMKRPAYERARNNEICCLIRIARGTIDIQRTNS